MKKLTYCLLTFFISVLIISCTDEELDPLLTDKVKKGTILALRGQQLNNIYFDGLPGAEFYPRVMTGEETFDFDAEYLSEDPESLESFDIFVVNKQTGERVKIKTVPFSEFKKTADYTRPWVSVSLKLKDILAAIGITDLDDPATIDLLLSTYQPGITIESDLNLKDGSKIPASEIVAAGLFDSDQFYPAQVLTFSAIEFCPFEGDTWDGVNFKTFEVYEDGSVSDFYTTTFEQDGVNPNKFVIHNFGANDGTDATIVFNPASLNVYEQTLDLEAVMIDGTLVKGSGTYNHCEQTLTINIFAADDEDEETIATVQFEIP